MLARRSAVAALLLLPLFWMAAEWTEFRTPVEIRSDGREVVWAVAGREIRASLPLTGITAIEIHVRDSVYPIGGNRIRIEENGRIRLDEDLPRRLEFTERPFHPLGDWFVDFTAASGTLYRRELPPLAAPFRIQTAFTGRSLEYVTIRLLGSSESLFQFRRGLLNCDFAITGPDGVLAVERTGASRSRMLASLLAFFLRAGVFAALLVAAFGAIATIFGAGRPMPTLGPRWSFVTVMLVAAGACGIALWVARVVLEAVPHIPDEVAYVLQAKWLAAGKLYQAIPKHAEHFTVPFTFIQDGKWFSIYPIGWPLLLSVGEALGSAWMVNPLFGGAASLLTYLVGAELYGRSVGLLAALFFALSPMSALMFGSLLSHGSAATMILLSLWLLLVGARTANVAAMFGAGFALGYAFSIRPLTAVALAIPFALFGLHRFARGTRFRLATAAIAGVLGGAVPALVTNHFVTGDAARFAYTATGAIELSLENLQFGIDLMDATFAHVPTSLLGWGWTLFDGWPSLALPLACVPFLVWHRTSTRDVFLAATLGVLIAVYAFHYLHGMHGYGARFLFEAYFALHLLTARGVQLLPDLAARTAADVRLRAGHVLVAVPLLFLIGSAATSLPARLELFAEYNSVSGALERQIRKLDVRRALVLLQRAEWLAWGDAGNLLPVAPTDDLVFAEPRMDPGPLLASYPDRPIYRWSGKLEKIRDPLPGSAPRVANETAAIPGPGIVLVLTAAASLALLFAWAVVDKARLLTSAGPRGRG